jgi:hypothetical protein
MSRSSSFALLSAFAVLASALPPLAADVHPNTQSGFPVDQAFQVGDVDSVNLFNGTLVLTVPVGPTYPVGGGMSYSLKLTYNSNPWYFQEIVFDTGSVTQAIPNPCSNAGLGWRLSLGSVNPPCAPNGDFSANLVYDDASGAQHILYPTFHAGEADDPGDSGSTQNVLYTRDGSYLRLRKLAAGQREIDFPDGTVHHFDAQGRLTEMRSRFTDALGSPTDWVRVTYNPNRWVITDSRGRTHVVTTRGDLPNEPETITQIDLAAFGGATATYSFTYTTSTIARGCTNTDSSISTTVSVPLLTAIGLPDGSSSRAMAR